MGLLGRYNVKTVAAKDGAVNEEGFMAGLSLFGDIMNAVFAA